MGLRQNFTSNDTQRRGPRRRHGDQCVGVARGPGLGRRCPVHVPARLWRDPRPLFLGSF